VGRAADRGAVEGRDRPVRVAGEGDDRVAGAALVVAEARRPALAERAELLVGGECGDVVEQRDQVRGVEDREAQRLVALDASHVVTLLDYVAAIATDERLSAFAKRWAARFRDHERSARDAVVALAADRDEAIAPLHRSVVGRAAHGAANAVGTFGEWFDSRAKR